MIINTGDNVTITRSNLAHKFIEKLTWTTPCVILQAVTGDKINVYGKVYLNIRFGDDICHHVAHVTDINDPFILEFDFRGKIILS